MRLYALAIFLNTLNLCFCETCVIDHEGAERLQEMDLRSHIVSCSDSEHPPVNKNETAGVDHEVTIKMNYLLNSFRFDLDEETITLYSWNYFDWQDDRLQWKPELFHGLKRTVVSSFSIWSPGIKLVNTVEQAYFDYLYAKCKVNNTGHVRCAARTDHTVLCKSFLKNWPYDLKTCVLEFDQFRPGEGKVIFNLFHVIFVVDSSRSRGWEIVNRTVYKNLTNGLQSSVKFSFHRQAEALESTIIVPSFVIAVLTVTCLLLDCKKNTRFGMLCFSVVSHFAVSDEICENLPKHTPDTPVILLFIGSSTVLTVIVFLLSFLFRFLAKRKTLPPLWVTAFNDWALTSHFKHLVVIAWVDDNDKDPNDSSKQWNTFIDIVNSICFFIYVVTYICLFATLTPSRPPGTFYLDDL